MKKMITVSLLGICFLTQATENSADLSFSYDDSLEVIEFEGRARVYGNNTLLDTSDQQRRISIEKVHHNIGEMPTYTLRLRNSAGSLLKDFEISKERYTSFSHAGRKGCNFRASYPRDLASFSIHFDCDILN